MPQNAIISASGGDYSTVAAWIAAEQASDYGEPTAAFIDGTVQAGGELIFNTAGGNWPHSFKLRPAVFQEYNGKNAALCARITHSSSLVTAANSDVDIQGLALAISGGYNNEVFKTSNTVSTTQRRNITLKNLYVESAPFYHGSTFAIEINTAGYASGAGSQYHLDLENIVIFARASNRALYVVGRDDNQSITGSIRQTTVLPTNSGTSVTNAFWVGGGNDSYLEVDKILSLAQEVRTNVTDYVNEGMPGTYTNISTNDDTGTVTGVTAASEFENYAAGDYRLKSTGSGNGAFPQATIPDEPTPQDAVTTDAVARTFVAVLSASQSFNLQVSSGIQRTEVTALPVSVASKPVAVNSQQRAFAQTLTVSSNSEFTAINARCRQSALPLTVSAALGTHAAQSVCRSYVQQLEITDELQIRPAWQRAYVEVLELAASMQPAAVNSIFKTYASSLQISSAMQANSISAIQRSYADLLSNADSPAPINTQKLTATLATSRLTATRLTAFLQAQLVTDNY